ncbi:MAG TPA: lysylphosphatidylglycerol synthase transmembrane domain-containing protein [Candidatus Polarisedimenticolia bacterium]|nr:lysylphosphatidylglycerol synthase transmembrane domain-containing protein [Candidatus Polarisedimenticolia bacterium]
MTGGSALTRFKVPLLGLKILLSILLFVYVILKVSPRDVWTTMRAADGTMLGVAAALFFVSGLIGSWLWARLLRAQGVVIPYPKAASYYFVGLFFNNFLPSNVGGDIARISDARKHAEHVSPVFSATLMERLIGVVAIGLLAVIAALAAHRTIHAPVILMTTVAVFLLAAALFFAVFHRGVLDLLVRPFGALGARRVERALGRLLDDVHGFRGEKGALAAAFAASMLVQVSRIYVHYLVGLALGVRLSLGYYFLFVPILAALISLPISLNGIGVREGAAVVLFQMVGLTREQSFSIPFLTYVISVLISLVGGLIFVSRTPLRALGRHLERRRRERAAEGQA